MAEHLDRLLEATSIVPAVNQLELHPFSAPVKRGSRAGTNDIKEELAARGDILPSKVMIS